MRFAITDLHVVEHGLPDFVKTLTK